MRIFIVVFLGTIHTLRCGDISSNQYDSDISEKHDWNKYEETDKSKEAILDKSSADTLDKSIEDILAQSSVEITTLHTSVEASTVADEPKPNRRYWLASSKLVLEPGNQPPDVDNEKDANLKSKIGTLVEQTLHDTERKLRSLHRLKEKHKNEGPYKVGFILSLVKKSKDILNELFNVAVKHRDDYKALEELKIFEYIVHTNVDTTNLVRQMVEIHMQNTNATSPLRNKNKVILL